MKYLKHTIIEKSVTGTVGHKISSYLDKRLKKIIIAGLEPEKVENHWRRGSDEQIPPKSKSSSSLLHTWS
jgi:hypothetical protein